jgi:hypothetical protein
MYDEAYGVEVGVDIHVAMYDEAYPTDDSLNASRLVAMVNSLPPTAAGSLKELRDCNDF